MTQDRESWKRNVVLAVVAGMIFLVQPSLSGSLRAQEHTGTKALCLSLIPGGGQIYNRQAWKIPIIYGAFAGMGYLIHDNYVQMKMFKDEYLFRQNHGGSTNLPDYAGYPTSSIYSLYNSYNQTYQLMIIITVGVYALNLIDAYVFGHLFEFQMTDDIALMPSLVGTPWGVQPTVGVTINL